MRVFWLLMLIAAVLQAEPVRLRCEHQVNPIGIDVAAPRFSWQNDSTERDWRQTAYEILVATTPDRLQRGKADVWSSGIQPSGESVGIAYAGPRLESRRRYYWTVRVWDGARRVSRYAPAAWFEMGLLAPSDWTARWISRPDPEAVADRADIRWIWAAGEEAFSVPLTTRVYFRLSVILDEKPLNAGLFLTARGDFTASVNGRELRGKTRSWEAFDRQDVAEYLAAGANTIEVSVTAAMPPDTPEPPSRRVPAGLAGLLKIVRSDGVMQRFPTDAHWEARMEGDRNWRPAAVAAELGDSRMTAGDPGPLPGPAALFRSVFSVSKGVQSARLYVTALGSYRMYLNGRQVGADVLTPDFTEYGKRVAYQTYDVTAMITQGSNVIGAILGDGWYASAMSWYGRRFFFGKGPTRLLAQLEINYRDGSRRVVGTDNNWRTSASQVLYSEIYGGEVQDARLEQPGWNQSGFQDERWTPAVESEAPAVALSAQVGAPVRVNGKVEPKSVTPRPGGAYIFDMGQNMVGWVRLRASGPAGTRIRLQFAEVLKPDGGIYVDNLRGANATDVFVLSGKGEEIFTPYFTFHGFRYVEVSGYPGEPTLAAITGEVLNSLPAEPAARLATSSSLVNRFYEVGLWGQRGNFLSIPTDCPQRDERLGWTGDAAVFWRTGAYNFDIAAFTAKWMRDLLDARTAEGAFTNTAPHVPRMPEGAPGWGDAGVIVPWTAWMQYGDTSYIERNWQAIERWLAYIQEGNPDFIRRNRVGPNFADWLAPDGRTNKDLIATAYWALIADMASQMARATGREAEAAKYQSVVASIREAFRKAFIRPGGVVDAGTRLPTCWRST
jgi:alpha-L-rhamnosidase